MSSMLIIILLINCAVSFLCAFRWKGEKEKLVNVFFFLALPVLGLGIYILPRLLLRFDRSVGYDRDSLVKRLEVANSLQMPEVREELSVIAVEDAMVVSNRKEKRSLMLKQLKKEEADNYRVVLAAGKDEDSETAHYVAAAKMEAYRNKFVDIIKTKNKVASGVMDGELVLELLEKIEIYIESELLAEKEAEIYKREYCQVLEEADSKVKKQLTVREYTNYISYLVDLDEYDKVQKVWDVKNENMICEKSFMKILEAHYKHREREKFYICLEQLKKSRIVLSPQGLEYIRFWESRR